MSSRVQWGILFLLIIIGVAYATYASRKEGPCTLNPQAVDCFHQPAH